MPVSQSHSGAGHNINAESVVIQNFPKHPYLLSDVINILSGDFIDNDSSLNGDLREVGILDKIEYNNLVGHRQFIREFSIYQGKIEEIYNEIESLASGRKTTILQNIRTVYLEERSATLMENQVDGMSEIDCIRGNADVIFKKIAEHLIAKVETSENLTAPHDAVRTAVYIVMVDAFIRCKILEAPIKTEDGPL